MPTHDQLTRLLRDLCVVYGFCLPRAENQKLLANPPKTADAFTDAVFVAEGMDPAMHQRLREKVRQHVMRTIPEGENSD